MLYVLAGTLVLLMFLGLITTKGDLFAPEVMLSIAFLFCTLCAIYQLRIWNHDIGIATYAIIVGAVLIAIFVDLAVRGLMPRRGKVRSAKLHASPIPDWAIAAFLILAAITCVVMAYEIRRIGGTGDFADVMVNYRQQSGYGTDLSERLPGWVSQLQNVVNVIGYLCIFNLIAFWDRLSRGQKAANILVVVLSALASMMTGGRFGTLCMVLGGLAMFWVVYYRNHGGASVRPSTVFKVLLAVVAALVVFYFAKDFVGRVSDDTMVDYLTHYAGGGIVGLDMYLAAPPAPSDIFGKETFYSLISGLRKLGLVDVPFYLIHHEFRISNGVGIGNIYTALRDYHYDFGFLGMVVLHVAFCIIMSWAYEHMKRHDSGLGTILLGMVYYCVPMYGISNCLYANIVSFGFLIKAVEAWALYKLLIEKSVFRQRDEEARLSRRRAMTMAGGRR